VNYILNLNHNDFCTLLGLPRERVEKYAQMREAYRAKAKGRPFQLHPFDEVVFILIYLRHYPVDLLLSAMFQLAPGTTAKLRKKMLEWFYNEVKDRIRFNTFDERILHAVRIFYTTYTWLIDGSEQPVMGSDNPMTDTAFYSQKKGKPTISILLIMDLGGRILFLSYSFGGISPDLALTLKTMHLWHHNFEAIENGIGDLGFGGARSHKLRLDVPPANHTLPLFKVFSSIRIKIEQKFSEIKDWRACKETLRIPPAKSELLLNTHHMHWTIVSVLVNEKNGYF
jgi:hypothetical protein